MDKLIYSNRRTPGEPIMYFLSYMGKKLDYLMPREDWPQFKEKVTFGKLPLLEIDENDFLQTTTVLRYLASEAGLDGENASENLQIDMIAAAFEDFLIEISRCFKTKNTEDKENLSLSIINNTVPFYMTCIEEVLQNNGGFLANGKLSWVDLYIVGYCTSMPRFIGIDVTEKYPFFKELTNKIHSLPGIKEWVEMRKYTPSLMKQTAEVSSNEDLKSLRDCLRSHI